MADASDEGLLKFNIPELPDHQKSMDENHVELSQVQQDLLDPANRNKASEIILQSVVNDKTKLSQRIIIILIKILSDKTLEIVTRLNAVKILTISSINDPRLMPILDKNLHDEDLNIRKVIMNRFIGSDYEFTNFSAIEQALLNPELKLWAIALIHKAAISKYSMNLQDSTIRYLNQLLDDSDTELKKYSLAIFTHRPDYVITNIKAVDKLIFDKDLNILCFNLLFFMANSRQEIDNSILDSLSKLSSDKYVTIKIRQYLLEILDLQIRNNNDISGFTGFSFLAANLSDANKKIVEKTTKILINGLEREVKLPNHTQLKDTAIVSEVIEILTELLRQPLCERDLKQDICYCLAVIYSVSHDTDHEKIESLEDSVITGFKACLTSPDKQIRRAGAQGWSKYVKDSKQVPKENFVSCLIEISKEFADITISALYRSAVLIYNESTKANLPDKMLNLLGWLLFEHADSEVRKVARDILKLASAHECLNPVLKDILNLEEHCSKMEGIGTVQTLSEVLDLVQSGSKLTKNWFVILENLIKEVNDNFVKFNNNVESDLKLGKIVIAIIEKAIFNGQDLPSGLIKIFNNFRLEENVININKNNSNNEDNLPLQRAKDDQLALWQAELSNLITISIEDSIKEKDLTLLLKEIEQLNENNQELRNSLGLLKSKFNDVISAYNSDSILTPINKKINKWQAKDIQNWSNELLTKNCSKALDKSFLAEMIAVVKRANIIATDKDPRTVQILGILILLLSPEEKGRLIQISTGEGKSTTSSMLSVILALRGEKVDIITSSQILAKRDAIERQEFLAMFNLTVMHNIDEEISKGPKPCYKADVVYGDVGSFQYDLLRHEYKGYSTRGDRQFNSVIIDEVDSMLIDDSSKLARLASHIPGTEYLEPLLAAAWYELEKLHKHLVYLEGEGWVFVQSAFSYENGVLTLLNEGNIDDKTEIFEQNVSRIENTKLFCKEHIVNYLTETVRRNLIKIPFHLEEFARSQIENWADSAVQAKHMVENKHYIILKCKAEYNIIVPVDYYNTGIVQENTKWNNGLHQFLQLKHNVKLSAEDFNTSFISNLGYFKHYGCKIFGMTGTLGSKYTQDLLAHIYSIDLAFVPTYKPKQFTEVPGVLVDGREKWLDVITEQVIAEANNNRAVLIICETIGNVNKVEEKLLEAGYPAGKIKRYSRNDNDEYLAIDDNICSGQIIIATNLAGRGTDIKTSKKVEDNGGLHVCVTFLPDNLRIEEQAFGRTARQGKKGTALLIIDQSEALLKLGASDVSVGGIADLKKLRDHVERQKLQEVRDNQVNKIITDDLLFGEFCKFTGKLREKANSPYKLLQLDESWGMWLKQIQEKLDKTPDMSNEQKREYALCQLQIFKDKIGKKYFDDYNIMQNPAYLVMEGLNKLGVNNRYQQSIDIFTLAINLDHDFNFAALYNRAYAKISQGYALSMQKGKFDSSWQQSACSDLIMARQQITIIVIPQLEAMQIISNVSHNLTDSSLYQQIISKINLLRLQVKYIDSVVYVIQNCEPCNIVKIINVELLRDLFSTSHLPEEEITELNFFGIHHFFEVQVIEPADNWGAGILVAALGVAQIALGAFCVTIGYSHLGVSLIMEGMQDLYKSIQIIQGGPFSWDSYFLDKGISIAATLAVCGIEAIGSSLKGVSNFVPKIALKEGIIKGSLKELAFQTIKEVAIKTVINIGMDHVANIISEETLRVFKEDVLNNVNAKINQCLSQQSVKQKLTRILAIDGFNHNSHYQETIQQAINDILRDRHSVMMDIINRTINSMTHSSDPTVKIIGYTCQGGKMVHELAKIVELIDNFCDNLVDRLNRMEQGLPKLSDLLYQNMKSKVDKQDIDGIIQKLEQGSIVKDGDLVLTAIYAIDATRFGEYEENKPQVVALCKKLHAFLSTNYNTVIDQLCQDTTQKVSSQLMSKIQGQLLCPIVKEGTNCVAEAISNKLIKASDQMMEASRGTNNKCKQNAVFNNEEIRLAKNTNGDFENLPTNKTADKHKPKELSNKRKKLQPNAPTSNADTMKGLVDSDRKIPDRKIIASLIPQADLQEQQNEPSAKVKFYDVNALPENNSKQRFSFFISDAYASSTVLGPVGTTAFLSDAIPGSISLACMKKISKMGLKVVPGLATAAGAAYLYQSNDYSVYNIIKNLVPYADIVTDIYEYVTNSEDKDVNVSTLKPITDYNMGVVKNNELLTISPYLDIDLDSGIPKLLTPIHQPKTSILVTPDLTDVERLLGKLPGFDIDDYYNKPLTETFPDHRDLLKNGNVLYKKEHHRKEKKKATAGKKDDKESKKQKWNECEKPESPFWRKLKPHKIIKGKEIKTDGCGKYFEWDNIHKEIEELDHKGNPVDALDPVTGQRKGKDVSGHRPVKVR